MLSTYTQVAMFDADGLRAPNSRFKSLSQKAE